MTYLDLQADHIAEAFPSPGDRRARKYAPRAHAAIVGVIEKTGLGVFDLSLDEMVRMVMPMLSLSGLMGLLFNWLIQRAVTRLIPVVIQWLRDKLQAWLDRNRSSSNGWQVNQFDAYGSVEGELSPIFAGAREFLERGTR